MTFFKGRAAKERDPRSTSDFLLDSTRALVHRYLDAFEARDISGCLDPCGDDAVLRFLGRLYRGRQAIGKWHEDRFAANLRVLRLEGISRTDDTAMVDLVVTSDKFRAYNFVSPLAVRVTLNFRERRINDIRFRLRRAGATATPAHTYLKYTLHPYLGFRFESGVKMRQHLSEERIYRLQGSSAKTWPTDWLDIESNNHGFFCRYNYPCCSGPNDDLFLVGVFGGSVAQWFAMCQERAFARRLETRARVRGKEVVILNFAIGGSKQPQTLFCLEYFASIGQRLDLVLLIDGFNEAALSWMNMKRGIPHFYPACEIMDRFGESDWSLPSEIGINAGSRDEWSGRVSEYWTTLSVFFHDFCRSRGIASVQLLQPNQYYSQKTFTPEEQCIAISGTTPYREAVESVYPHLARAVSEIRGRGGRCYDGTRIFDFTQETIFADNCCHYNQRGNEILAEFLAECIEEDHGGC